MTDTEKLGEVYKILNPDDNGGETVAITIEIFDNGDHGSIDRIAVEGGGWKYGWPDSVFTLSKVDLQSYGNSASISLPNLTPKFLRELANELDATIAKTKKVAND